MLSAHSPWATAVLMALYGSYEDKEGNQVTDAFFGWHLHDLIDTKAG